MNVRERRKKKDQVKMTKVVKKRRKKNATNVKTKCSPDETMYFTTG
jgi:hypothetical protein